MDPNERDELNSPWWLLASSVGTFLMTLTCLKFFYKTFEPKDYATALSVSAWNFLQNVSKIKWRKKRLQKMTTSEDSDRYAAGRGER